MLHVTLENPAVLGRGEQDAERFWDEGRKRLKIGMEVSPLSRNVTGIPNYIRRLLLGLADIDRNNQYYLYTNRPMISPPDLPDNFKFVLVNRPTPRFQIWFQLSLPRRLKRDGVDIFHGPFCRLPLVLPVPGVITVHDLSGYKMPKFHKARTHLTNRMYPIYLRRAAGIIAVSHFTASEIADAFPWIGEKVQVVHEAAPGDLSRITDSRELDRVRKKYGLPHRFLLFLGTIEPRKNIERLLNAFIKVSHTIPHSLVLAGVSGWKTENLFSRVGDAGLESRVVRTGFVESEHLAHLFSLAEFFIYPSLYEGFGLPVLEAMACGTPVITSSTSSLPEVAGEAAILVDPEKEQELAEAISELALNRERRSVLGKMGLERSSLFSWRKTAEETLGIYERILSARGKR